MRLVVAILVGGVILAHLNEQAKDFIATRQGQRRPSSTDPQPQPAL